MSKPTRKEIREMARLKVAYYSASLDIEDNASVRKGQKEHLQPDLEPTKGWWVDCKIFVPEDFSDEE